MKEYYRTGTDYATMQHLADIIAREGTTRETLEAAADFQIVADVMIPSLPEQPSAEQTDWVNRTLWHFFDRLETTYLEKGVSKPYADAIVSINQGSIERVFAKTTGLYPSLTELHGL